MTIGITAGTSQADACDVKFAGNTDHELQYIFQHSLFKVTESSVGGLNVFVLEHLLSITITTLKMHVCLFLHGWSPPTRVIGELQVQCCPTCIALLCPQVQ